MGAPIEAPLAVGPEPLEVRDDAAGPGVVEAYTVQFDREGALVRGIVVGRTDRGARFLAHLPNDPALLERFDTREHVGCRGRVRADGDRLRFDPGETLARA